jgi:MerR family redox-sensitive transcriptional activator SoxR
VLRRLAFVRAAQNVGLTLPEIREALATLPDGRTPSGRDWARLSESWRERLDERIAALVQLRDGLSSCIGCGCLSLTPGVRLYNPGDVAAARGAGGAPAVPGTAAGAATLQRGVTHGDGRGVTPPVVHVVRVGGDDSQRDGHAGCVPRPRQPG